MAAHVIAELPGPDGPGWPRAHLCFRIIPAPKKNTNIVVMKQRREERREDKREEKRRDESR